MTSSKNGSGMRTLGHVADPKVREERPAVTDKEKLGEAKLSLAALAKRLAANDDIGGPFGADDTVDFGAGRVDSLLTDTVRENNTKLPDAIVAAVGIAQEVAAGEPAVSVAEQITPEPSVLAAVEIETAEEPPVVVVAQLAEPVAEPVDESLDAIDLITGEPDIATVGRLDAIRADEQARNEALHGVIDDTPYAGRLGADFDVDEVDLVPEHELPVPDPEDHDALEDRGGVSDFEQAVDEDYQSMSTIREDKSSASSLDDLTNMNEDSDNEGLGGSLPTPSPYGQGSYADTFMVPGSGEDTDDARYHDPITGLRTNEFLGDHSDLDGDLPDDLSDQALDALAEEAADLSKLQDAFGSIAGDEEVDDSQWDMGGLPQFDHDRGAVTSDPAPAATGNIFGEDEDEIEEIEEEAPEVPTPLLLEEPVFEKGAAEEVNPPADAHSAPTGESAEVAAPAAPVRSSSKGLLLGTAAAVVIIAGAGFGVARGHLPGGEHLAFVNNYVPGLVVSGKVPAPAPQPVKPATPAVADLKPAEEVQAPDVTIKTDLSELIDITGPLTGADTIADEGVDNAEIPDLPAADLPDLPAVHAPDLPATIEPDLPVDAPAENAPDLPVDMPVDAPVDAPAEQSAEPEAAAQEKAEAPADAPVISAETSVDLTDLDKLFGDDTSAAPADEAPLAEEGPTMTHGQPIIAEGGIVAETQELDADKAVADLMNQLDAVTGEAKAAEAAKAAAAVPNVIYAEAARLAALEAESRAVNDAQDENMERIAESLTSMQAALVRVSSENISLKEKLESNDRALAGMVEILREYDRVRESLDQTQVVLLDVTARVARMEGQNPANREEVSKQISDVKSELDRMQANLAIIARMTVNGIGGPVAAGGASSELSGVVTSNKGATQSNDVVFTQEHTTGPGTTPPDTPIPGNVKKGDFVDGYGYVLDIVPAPGGQKLVVMENASVLVQ